MTNGEITVGDLRAVIPIARDIILDAVNKILSVVSEMDDSHVITEEEKDKFGEIMDCGSRSMNSLFEEENDAL